MKAVVTNNLSKIYDGGNRALNDISFSLDTGEIFGFLGPNGAGKTTTVKLLCGMLAPTGGECRVFDYDPLKNPEEIHQISGVLTEHAQMYDYMSGIDNLIFYGKLFGMDEADCKKKAGELLERLDLLDAEKRKLSAYSTGMRQRLSLARAMMHSPKILFLDEPTSGLDPESAQNVNSLIQELADAGTTVFLCTHQLRYAQEICTTYGLMNKGDLLAVGDIEQLRGMVSSGVRLCIKASSLSDGMNYRMVDKNSYEIIIESENAIPRIVKDIVMAGGDIYQVVVNNMSLEEVYFSLINNCSGGEGCDKA